MTKLTRKQKKIIRMLNLTPFTVEFCEKWINCSTKPFNLPQEDAITLSEVATFLAVVNWLANHSVPRTNGGFSITSSVVVGDTEFVLANLSAPDRLSDMYVTWECSADDPDSYYRGDYVCTPKAALESLISRVQKKMQRLYPTTVIEEHPELARYDEDQFDMDRPLDDTPMEMLNRYEIEFKVRNHSFYCFADALTIDEALGQFFREHPSIPYGAIASVMEI